MKYIIYKIQINDYIYIGSTKNFNIRKSDHKRACNNGSDLLVYRTIREHGGWQYCTMVPVREVEVETIIQARIVEEEERVKYNAQMNTYRAYRTEEDCIAYGKMKDARYHEANKEKRLEKNRKWREANKEYLAEYNKKRCEENKEKRAEANKLWREENKEKRAEANKLWREENKEKRAEYHKKYREAKKAEQTSPSIV